MCVVILTICAFCFFMVIKRGRAFIEIGETRAKEAEQLFGIYFRQEKIMA
jgi:hypothetical protein